MAKSPSHRFGQIVGEILEEVVSPLLQEFCEHREMFLDKKGTRGKARKGKKVTWEDNYGNKHDLDFVIERGGTTGVRGVPAAFIEVAWHRYTKHSRNKVQEIQGAVLPVAERYSWCKPFLGVILAGVFTESSLTQMRSLGFEVLAFPYDTILHAFGCVGVVVAFDEDTPDADFKEAVKKIEAISVEERVALKESLVQSNQQRLDVFMEKLKSTLDRQIESVVLVPLHGEENRFEKLTEAIVFVERYDEQAVCRSVFRKYEVVVKFSNGDKIDASFKEKQSAIRFLNSMTAI